MAGSRISITRRLAPESYESIEALQEQIEIAAEASRPEFRLFNPKDIGVRLVSHAMFAKTATNSLVNLADLPKHRAILLPKVRGSDLPLTLEKQSLSLLMGDTHATVVLRLQDPAKQTQLEASTFRHRIQRFKRSDAPLELVDFDPLLALASISLMDANPGFMSQFRDYVPDSATLLHVGTSVKPNFLLRSYLRDDGSLDTTPSPRTERLLDNSDVRTLQLRSERPPIPEGLIPKPKNS